MVTHDAMKSRGSATQCPSDFPVAETRREERDRLLDIDLYPGTPKALPLSPGSLQPCPRTLSEAGSLLFGHPGEDSNEQVSHRTIHREPGLGDRHDADPTLRKLRDRFEVPNHRAPKTIDGEDNKDLELATVCGEEELIQDWTPLSDAAHFVEHPDYIVVTSPYELQNAGALVLRFLLGG